GSGNETSSTSASTSASTSGMPTGPGTADSTGDPPATGSSDGSSSGEGSSEGDGSSSSTGEAAHGCDSAEPQLGIWTTEETALACAMSPLPSVAPSPTNAFADVEAAAELGQQLYFEA